TASGKSDLAVQLAKKFNGEVISADSRQVYKGLDLGTGKITKQEMRGIRHHLLDVAPPPKQFDVAQYQKLTHHAIAGILKRGKLPIVCGGTGLYISAIVDNPSYPSATPDKRLRAQLEHKSPATLFAMLKKLDPARAQIIDRNNPRRLIRAIEIAKAHGPAEALKKNPLYDTLLIGIRVPPEKLKTALRARLLKRMRQGMVQEVKRLHTKGVSWKRMEELGLEYRYGARYLRGELSKQELIETLTAKIWQYSRRQMTWFRKMPNIRWCTNKQQAMRGVRMFTARY
ncbi:MAG: tRNA (adenosine(37)-N6)-dimethylallyltransferase MiaA, partial [Patescibacteria group bacterium]